MQKGAEIARKWRAKNPERERTIKVRYFVNTLRKLGFTVIVPEEWRRVDG